MALKYNDIIPLGVSVGFVSLLANDNGLKYIPLNSLNKGRGNTGYHMIDVPVTDENAIALRLLGVNTIDILKAKNARIKEK